MGYYRLDPETGDRSGFATVGSGLETEGRLPDCREGF